MSCGSTDEDSPSDSMTTTADEIYSSDPFDEPCDHTVRYDSSEVATDPFSSDTDGC